MDELRGKLEEKNKIIEKKTSAALHATQDKNRVSNELSELRDQVDIKDRKINVLHRKVSTDGCQVWGLVTSNRVTGEKTGLM